MTSSFTSWCYTQPVIQCGSDKYRLCTIKCEKKISTLGIIYISIGKYVKYRFPLDFQNYAVNEINVHESSKKHTVDAQLHPHDPSERTSMLVPKLEKHPLSRILDEKTLLFHPTSLTLWFNKTPLNKAKHDFVFVI